MHDRLLIVCNNTIIGERNRTFAKHLLREADENFTFLDATNWRAEQAIRPAVVNHKTAGGNRTDHGAHTQVKPPTLASFLVTARQQGHNAIDRLVELARAPAPTLAFTIH